MAAAPRNPLAPSRAPVSADVVVPVAAGEEVDAGWLRDVAPGARTRVVRYSTAGEFAACCNAAFGQCEGDVLLLRPGARLSAGWLEELGAVAWSDERTACALPSPAARAVAGEVVRRATAGLPRSTVVPTDSGPCLYLRGPILQIVGGFDPACGGCEASDWILRAQWLGFVARRANRVLVSPPAPVAAVHDERLARRHRQYAAQARRFRGSLDERLVDHAVRVEASGRLRVALDLRGLGPWKVGTSVYGIRLAEALASSPEVDLTLAVRGAPPVENLRARVLHDPPRIDDVEVVHKPGQVFFPPDLPLLYRSPAHLVLTYQDLIAYRAEGVLGPSGPTGSEYRAMSFESVRASQHLIAISEAAAGEIVDEFGVAREHVTVVHHAAPVEGARPAGGVVGVARPYFLAVGTDFPHKNLDRLIDAWRRLDAQWRGPSPRPSLVLVGNAYEHPESAYRRLQASPIPGVSCLGEVDDRRLDALLRGATALVFPSVYEGFGLPPLEAMAAGTPVIALPLSAVVEVCAEAALYPKRLDAPALARAMMRVATDEGLRGELRAAGLARAREFTARRFLDGALAAYRAAVRRPSPRSLALRHHLAARLVPAADAQRPLWRRPEMQPLVLTAYDRLARYPRARRTLVAVIKRLTGDER